VGDHENQKDPPGRYRNCSRCNTFIVRIEPLPDGAAILSIECECGRERTDVSRIDNGATIRLHGHEHWDERGYDGECDFAISLYCLRYLREQFHEHVDSGDVLA